MKAEKQRQFDVVSRVRYRPDFRSRDVREAVGNDPLLRDLAETPAFQRLKDIRFLGAIDFRLIPSPNGKPRATRYTRYEHSLGVVRLARLYCASQDMQAADQRLVCVAALLHDIGHPPLSHSMEPVFKEKCGIDHHRATEDIICGRVTLGKEVFSTLERHGMDVGKLIALISGECTDFHGFFNGPISFDTIEGILRSFRYTQETPTTPNPESVAYAAIRRTALQDQVIVDGFWQYKNLVYKTIVNSREGILSDFASRLFLQRKPEFINLDCYFGTEAMLFRKLPDLRKLLISNSFEEKITRMVKEPVGYWDRDYYIDQKGDFFARQDSVRYRHNRKLATLKLEDPPRLAANETAVDFQGGLFDDYPL